LFRLPEKSDGTSDLAFIHEVIEEHEGALMRNPDLVKFRYTVNKELMEDLLSYNKALEYMTASDLIEEPEWKYNRITGHKEMKPSDADYKGATINLEIEWKNNTARSYEDLPKMIKLDADMCYKYALDNNLLGKRGWGRLKRKIDKKKLIERQVNAASLKTNRFNPIYMFGVRVPPRNHKEAMVLDGEKKDQRWRDAEYAELSSLQGFQAFKDIGHSDRTSPPKGYTKITGHMVYAVKHDGRHKARYVAGGHLTETPVDSVYSSVVSLRGIRLLVFIAQLTDWQSGPQMLGTHTLKATPKKRYISSLGQNLPHSDWKDTSC
jgi:hypothetical protein